MKKETSEQDRRSFLHTLGRLAAGSGLLLGTGYLFMKKKVKRVPCGADYTSCRACSLEPECGLIPRDNRRS